MNALTVPSLDQMTVVRGLAEHFVKSGLFRDTSDVSKAIVKIMLGQSMGIGPVESMMGVNIIQGRPALAANLIAAKVKGSGKYDYRIVEQTDIECVIHFFQKGEFVGQASFTMDDARKAGLTEKTTWKQYPSDMLFARAISRGARRFCPDAFGGTVVYTPEEMGAEVDPESGQVLKSPVLPQSESTDGEFIDDVPVMEIEAPTTPTGGNAKTRLERLNEVGAAKYGDDWQAVRDELVKAKTGGKSSDPHKLMPSVIDEMIKELTPAA